MVIKFVCEYNGKGFCGFQRQKNQRSVQGVLEEALSKYFKENIKIVGSGRTDAGVHARGQVCSFKINDCEMLVENLYKLTSAINAFLPEDVAVNNFEIMPNGFHAQFSAKAKTYIYKCYVSQHRSPLRDNTHLQLYKLPDVFDLNKRASKFVGTHSFKEFCREKTDSKDFIRTIYSFDVVTVQRENCIDEIHFIVRGNGFMHNMVRIMCGIVLDMGKTLPAHGLILYNVEY